MKILADENISPIIVDRLRQAGQQVRSIFEIARGSGDIDILRMANEGSELLLTDDKDFGDLVIYQQYQSVGVLLLRLQGVPLIQRAEIVLQIIQENGEKLLNAFTVVKGNKSRTIWLVPKSRPETE